MERPRLTQDQVERLVREAPERHRAVMERFMSNPEVKRMLREEHAALFAQHGIKTDAPT